MTLDPNLSSCEISHDLNVSTEYKFELVNPGLKYDIQHFLDLDYSTKVSRLAFDCGDAHINKYVHRVMWPITERRKAQTVNLIVDGNIEAVMSYSVNPFYSKKAKEDLQVTGSDKIIYLHFLAVNKTYQRQEVGTMLLDMLIDECEDLAACDSSYKYLVLQAESLEACEFYEQYGFVEFDVTPTGGSMYALPLF